MYRSRRDRAPERADALRTVGLLDATFPREADGMTAFRVAGASAAWLQLERPDIVNRTATRLLVPRTGHREVAVAAFRTRGLEYSGVTDATEADLLYPGAVTEYARAYLDAREQPITTSGGVVVVTVQSVIAAGVTAALDVARAREHRVDWVHAALSVEELSWVEGQTFVDSLIRRLPARARESFAALPFRYPAYRFDLAAERDRLGLVRRPESRFARILASLHQSVRDTLTPRMSRISP
ncbi:MAG: hypothetical protein JWL73_3085 [Actinomycetia bacterium]|nr:hypothetical protein [Actinomycetes bacterium]